MTSRSRSSSCCRKDEKGLVPAIVQDASTSEVLMLGYMSHGSLKRTLERRPDLLRSAELNKEDHDYLASLGYDAILGYETGA